MADDSESSKGESVASVEPLGRVERATAIAVGIMAGGGGGYAVFASSNQAGTAILLILSAIFLLIGIQGTSLVRFSAGTNTVELDQRRRNIEQAVKEAVREDDVERAAGIVEGVRLANPQIGSPSYMNGYLYEKRLELSLMAMGYLVMQMDIDIGPDLTVTDPRTQSVVNVEAKFAGPNARIQARVIRGMVDKYSRSIAPVLLVTNAENVGYLQSVVMQDYPKARIGLVIWRDSADDEDLRNALVKLFPHAEG